MQIEYRKTYQEYKAVLDAELNKTAEGFVRIGYLLKVARDTDILRESGYTSVTEFAEAEYNLDKSQVSRFIHINDKFAEGGYSDRLQDQYQGFGYAKLTLMLQLPDAINEALSPSYSKAEIQAIKEEVDAENQVTDLERMMEPVPMPTPQEAKGSILNAAIYQLGEDEPELYVEMAAVQTIQELQEAMAPSGERTYSIRIPGTGRIMLMLSDASDDVNIVNVRTGEKESASWENMFAAWQQLLDGDGSPEHWEETYGKEYPKEEPPVAPVQPKPEKSKKVVKAKPEKEKNRINTKSERLSKPPEKPQEEPIEQSIAAQETGEPQENEEKAEIETVQKEPENEDWRTNKDNFADPEAEESEEKEPVAAGSYEQTIKELIEKTANQAKKISNALNKGRKELNEYRIIRGQVHNLSSDLEQLIKFIDLSTPEENEEEENEDEE